MAKVGRPSMLSQEELNALVLDYIYFDDSSEELSELYRISPKSTPHFMKKGVKEGIVSGEIARNVAKRRKNIGATKPRNSSKLSNEQITQLIRDYGGMTLAVDDLAKRYGISSVSNYLHSAVRRGLFSQDEIENLISQRKSITGAKNMQLVDRSRKRPDSSRRRNGFYGKNHSEQTRRRISETAKEDQRGLRLAELVRTEGFTLEEELYSSRGEAATAELLQRYIPGYQIQEGESFQVSQDTGKLFDFVLPDGKILEWHPIVPKWDGQREGTWETYKELMKIKSTMPHHTLKGVVCKGARALDAQDTTPHLSVEFSVKYLDITNPKEKSKLKREYLEELAVNYWMSRQEASDNSKYFNGAEVILARDFDELYDSVLRKYGKDIPEREILRQEFNLLRNKAKPINLSDSENLSTAPTLLQLGVSNWFSAVLKNPSTPIALAMGS